MRPTHKGTPKWARQDIADLYRAVRKAAREEELPGVHWQIIYVDGKIWVRSDGNYSYKVLDRLLRKCNFTIEGTGSAKWDDLTGVTNEKKIT